MRITSLEINGYGVWSGLAVPRLNETLSVVYGPNEAGKTTLLQFIRSVLYGFTAERRRYFPPVHGGRPGGWLELAGPAGRFQIDRGEADGQSGRELLTITAADGTRPGEQMLGVLLANVDELIFNNVFAVGLREIQELGTLSGTQAAELLYNLTAGLDRISLVEVMDELATLRNRLLDPQGEPCLILQLTEQRERLRQEIEGADSLTRRYGRLAGDRYQLDSEISRLSGEKDHTSQQVQILELAISLRGRWARRTALEQELAALGPHVAMPVGAVARLELIHRQIQKHRARLRRLKKHGHGLRDEVSGLKINDSLERNSARIEAIKEQQAWIQSVQGQVGQLQRETDDLEASLTLECEQLGLGRPTGPDALSRLSERMLGRLRSPAKILRQTQQELDEARKNAGAAQQSAGEVGRQIAAALTTRKEQSLATAMDHAGDRVAQLRRRIQIDERLDQLARYQADLDQQRQRSIERQILPGWVLAGLGGVFVLGAMLLLGGLAGFLISSTVFSSFGWPMVLVGLVGIGAGAFGKTVIERSNARQLDACDKQIAMLQSQIEQTENERERLEGQLPSENRSLEERLAAAERELAELEELVPLDTRRSVAGQESAAAEQRAAQAEEQFRRARQRWRDALTAVGLPVAFTPKQVRQVMLRSQRLAEIQQQLVEQRREHSQRQQELAMLVDRIGQLINDCGVAIAPGEPLVQLRQLTEALSQQKTQLARRDELLTQLRKLRRRRRHIEEAALRLKRRRRSLLREFGAVDEDDLRRRAAVSAKADLLRQEHEGIDREIAAALGGRCSAETLRQYLDADVSGGLERRRDEALDRLTTMQTEYDQRLEKRGQFAAEMKTLADDRQLALRQLDMAVIEKRLEDAIRRWQVLGVTYHVLEQIRSLYEHERQPETLKEASGYLERFTQGRYSRVWTPLGGRTLLVDDAQGQSLPVEVLSQGTREQLFLSLRLALAALYARRGAAMPLVLDDVLVNFDVERAKAAATVLRDFAAAGHQLLVFTCHEHIHKLFKAMKVPAGTLPDNSHGQPTEILFDEPPREKVKEPPKESPKEKPKRAARSAPPKKAVKEPPPVEDEEDELPEDDADEPAAKDSQPSWEDEPEEPEEDLWQEDDA